VFAPPFFMTIWAVKALEPSFASPSYNRSHGTTRIPKVRQPEMVRHETKAKMIK
jgi:hypothetical protein